MTLSDNQTRNFLFATQGVGAVFVAIFLIAYLGGLPTTNVLHSLPVFRYSLDVIGIALLALITATVAMALYRRTPQNPIVQP
jgi:hypothetical protein